MSLLGLDIGTTGTKAVVFSETGSIVDSNYQEYPLIYPKPGWAELSPAKVWQAVKKTVSQVAHNNPSIRALCISCLGNNIIPVANNGMPNYNGILAFDTRTSDEVETVNKAIGRERFFKITGSPMSTLSNLSKILWLQRNRQDVFQSTWKFMMFADYILFRMGFPPTTTYSMASLNIFDIKRKEYPETMLKEFGLASTLFPDPVPPGHIIGEIPVSTRSELGLPKGTQVIAGGIDLACGVLGAGVSPQTPDRVADVAGTFEHAAYVTEEPVLEKLALDKHVLCFCNVYHDSYVVFRSLPTASAAINWFRDEFAHEEMIEAEKEGKNVYDVMFEPLQFNGSNTVIIHPYFAGRYGDSSARGSIIGLTLGTKRKDILTGLVEGITHELRTNIEIIERLAKKQLSVVRVVGGMAKSQKWLQLKADLTGRTIERVSITEASALGAALLAGVATGVYASIDEAVRNTTKVTDSFSPRPEMFEAYNKQHEVYKRLAPHWRQ